MFAKKVCIDLGSKNSRVWVEKRGTNIVFNEPTLVAIDTNTERVVAVGSEAEKLVGKSPENIKIIQPIHHGSIVNYDLSQKLLKHFLDLALGTFRLVKPSVYVSVASDLTNVESKTLVDCLYQAGAGEIYLIPESLAAGIGAGLSIFEASGSMIVHIGYGKSEFAIISFFGLVYKKSLRFGLQDISENINIWFKKTHQLEVSNYVTESIIENFADLSLGKKSVSIEIKGRDSYSGLPKSVTISGDSLSSEVLHYIVPLVDAAREFIENCSPEISADIIDKGTVLTGGGALIVGLRQYLSKELNIVCHFVDGSDRCTIEGLKLICTKYDNYIKGIKKYV